MKTQVYLTPKDHGRPLSLEEFQHAGSQEGYHYELIDGKLEVSPLPNMPHDELRDWLRDKLYEYIRLHPEAINHVKAPARVFVPGRRATTAPEPDIAAYSDFPLDLPRAQRHWQDHSPALVAEILSEDNADKDLVRNLALYLEVPSIREYWIIDPRRDADHPSLTVHRRRGRRWQNAIEVPAGATYTTRLLPGFQLIF
jgi:Uma2 family endonuclease